MSPQASPPQKRTLGQPSSVAKLEGPEVFSRNALLEEKQMQPLSSSQKKALSRQNTDVSDTSELFATPPTSPLGQSVLSPAEKSPSDWNSNPLYRTAKSNSPSRSPTRSRSARSTAGKSTSPAPSPTRSQSFRSALSSFSAGTPSSPTSKQSARITSRSSSLGSPSGSGNYFTFSTTSEKSVSGATVLPSSLSSGRGSSVANNESSVISQQNVVFSADPPPPPTRTDSIAKARIQSRKLDAENMLYGGKDQTPEDEKETSAEHKDSGFKGSRVRDRSSTDFVNSESLAQNRKQSFDDTLIGHTTQSEKIGVVDVVNTTDLEAVAVQEESSDTVDTKSYLDGFVIDDVPDNALIKPSKLRESMRRRSRAKRAQTAPVEREAVNKALSQMDRKWKKPEQNGSLSHLPLADRLALKKRSTRELNNNDIGKVLTKDAFPGVAATKVLPSNTTSTAVDEPSMKLPVSADGDHVSLEAPSITPVLHLSRADPDPSSATRDRSPSPSRTIVSLTRTSRSEAQFTRRSAPASLQASSELLERRNSDDSESVRTNRRILGRSGSVDNQVNCSVYACAFVPSSTQSEHKDPEFRSLAKNTTTRTRCVVGGQFFRMIETWYVECKFAPVTDNQCARFILA